MQNYRMIDVGDKQVTQRKAIAVGHIKVAAKTMAMIKSGHSPKGNILSIAEVAGIMAAKNTSQYLPLCHPLLLDSVKIWFELSNQTVKAFCEVNCSAKTGVEMEALVGVNTCLLTIYDLAKAVDPVIEISQIYLDTKMGGKSGVWHHPEYHHETQNIKAAQLAGTQYNFGVVTLSDRASSGHYSDQSGPLLVEHFNKRGYRESFYKVIADNQKDLRDVIDQSVKMNLDVLLLTGGTGISKRDITPDVVKSYSHKELSGFGELQRTYGAQFTSNSWLSRSSAYVIESTLIVLFPGSPKAVAQGLEAVGDLVPHAIKMIRGESHEPGAKVAEVQNDIL